MISPLSFSSPLGMCYYYPVTKYHRKQSSIVSYPIGYTLCHSKHYCSRSLVAHHHHLDEWLLGMKIQSESICVWQPEQYTYWLALSSYEGYCKASCLAAAAMKRSGASHSSGFYSTAVHTHNYNHGRDTGWVPAFCSSIFLFRCRRSSREQRSEDDDGS